MLLRRTGAVYRGWFKLAPVVSAAAAAETAAIVPGAGVVRAEVGAAHVAVAGAGLSRIRGRYHTAVAPAAIQEMMRQFLTGNHARAHRQAGGQATGYT
jgi:hypothetical protein